MPIPDLDIKGLHGNLRRRRTLAAESSRDAILVHIDTSTGENLVADTNNVPNINQDSVPHDTTVTPIRNPKISSKRSVALALQPIFSVSKHYDDLMGRAALRKPSKADWRIPLDQLSSHLWMYEGGGHFSHWYVMITYQHESEMMYGCLMLSWTTSCTFLIPAPAWSG
jgi:hypothetical protein